MKVSIITDFLNSAATIRDTIDSVLSQTCNDIENIIVDGASSDGTSAIVSDYEEQISKIVSEKDKSIYDAMNKGVDLASGDVIGILNSDDVYATNHAIDDVVEELSAGDGIEALLGDVIFLETTMQEEASGAIKRSCSSHGCFALD
ncbi:glycosyltransferase [Halomonas beimenensis]|uniref:Glycosyltransferase 2-like domain-containing protein n=1 Tax=Halomonas beimenensis TaxID=475662 RepID=A0A291P727_9GAMM|nr:glycosyltransferase [Halomonas beimenensis]ATJ82680.1 hypothetical protein BEI_1693 [Halomonas beimenensis]